MKLFRSKLRKWRQNERHCKSSLDPGKTTNPETNQVSVTTPRSCGKARWVRGDIVRFLTSICTFQGCFLLPKRSNHRIWISFDLHIIHSDSLPDREGTQKLEHHRFPRGSLPELQRHQKAPERIPVEAIHCLSYFHHTVRSGWILPQIPPAVASVPAGSLAFASCRWHSSSVALRIA